jgi:TldD protein
MRSKLFTTALCGLGILLLTASFGQDRAPSGSGIVMQAMNDELLRSMSELQLKDLEKPYFIQYTVVDEDEYTGEASCGALTSWKHTTQRVLHVQVRVGSHELDNSDFMVGRGGYPGMPVQAVIDNDYGVLRHALWLATDTSYKQAVETLARKRAYLQNKVQNEEIPDFTRESATNSFGARQTLHLDVPQIQKQLRDWSRIFKSHPEILNSRIRFVARSTHRYLVNSEGTRVQKPDTLVALDSSASAQAPDGMQISHSVPFLTRSLWGLPSPQQFEQSIRNMITELKAVCAAPVLEADYAGPVLLTGPASSDFFARVLAVNLSGQRGPITERSQPGGRTSELYDRLNRPVLPAFLSVYDDPFLKQFEGNELVGYYEIDDQGVPARRVSLVEDGLLTDLLLSRKPIKGRMQSNGHGRSGYPGRETAQISNLVITATQGKSFQDLKGELVKLCRTERLPFGIIIRELGPSGAGLGIPFLAYKVDAADEHEQLVRGTSSPAFPVRSLRHIQAAGKQNFIAARLAGIPGAETPVTVIAPSILVEEMELKRFTGSQQRPALLGPPPRP